jgi:hypothetical protein
VCNWSANKSNHPKYNPSFSSRVPPYTWQYSQLFHHTLIEYCYIHEQRIQKPSVNYSMNPKTLNSTCAEYNEAKKWIKVRRGLLNLVKSLSHPTSILYCVLYYDWSFYINSKSYRKEWIIIKAMKYPVHLHNMHFNLVSASVKRSKYSEVSSEFWLNFLKFKFNFLNTVWKWNVYLPATYKKN